MPVGSDPSDSGRCYPLGPVGGPTGPGLAAQHQVRAKPLAGGDFRPWWATLPPAYRRSSGGPWWARLP